MKHLLLISSLFFAATWNAVVVGAFVHQGDSSCSSHLGIKLPRSLQTSVSRSCFPLNASSRKESLVVPIWQQDVVDTIQDISESVVTALRPLFLPDDSVTAADIIAVCDDLDERQKDDSGSVTQWIRCQALRFQRHELLAKLMRSDYAIYTATASFLSPSRIPRLDLPNLQDVPIGPGSVAPQTNKDDINEDGLIPDCELPSMNYNDSLLDLLLLSIFRKLVSKNTDGVTSDVPGILGLLDQGRTYMLQGHSPERQQQMVRETLGDLMTPILPPFYRIFMSGIVPQLGTPWDGKQLGPWFYAPWLTSMVTPTFFGFLVGPSYPNRRKDGHMGGLVVEKCKYLQESGCKGLCLHQCKLPAQQFFMDELGLPLTVTPNFETQECQWSFGETPLPVEDDSSFPQGCLVGCESRKAVAASSGTEKLANFCS